MKRLAIFCGASLGNSTQYKNAAEALGHYLAEKKIGIVYGGAHIGIMGAIADACLSRGGDVIGVIPQGLFQAEVAHEKLKDLRVVSSMHERKALMEKLADGFIALPGGFGTLDEMCEIITWNQIHIHDKPMAFLNTNGFFNPFITFYQHASVEGFIQKDFISKLIVESDFKVLLSKMGF